MENNRSHRQRLVSVLVVLLTILAVSHSVAVAAEWAPRIRAAVERAVMERNGYDLSQLKITLHKLRVPSRYRNATRVTTTLPAFADAIGPVTLRAEFFQGDRSIGSMPVPVRVNVVIDALVTTHKIGRKEVIKRGDLKTARVDVTKLVRWAQTDPDSVVGRWATRTINAGQIVDSRWLADVPIIRRGDRVSLTYQTGAVRVSSSVVAMEDGYRDQEIRVKNENAKRLLSAVVIDSRTVRPVR